MKKLCIILFLFVFTFSGLMITQEVETQKIELPQRTDEYLANRGLGNTMSWFFSGIAYAKSKGDTPV